MMKDYIRELEDSRRFLGSVSSLEALPDVHRQKTESLVQFGSAPLTTRDLNPDSQSEQSENQEYRDSIGWGRKYIPPIDAREKHSIFRRWCDAIITELNELQQFLVEGKVTEEGAGQQSEIMHYLQEIYDFEWGDGESLKSVVTCVEFQINNTVWDTRHVAFLRGVFEYLRRKYYIDQEKVDHCYDLVEQCGLDPFRGTISEPDVKVKYKLVVVEE